MLGLLGAPPAAEEPSVLAKNATTHESSPQNGCVGCHENAPGELSRAVEDWRKSIHAEKGVTCDACHGGDPEVRGGPDDRAAVDAGHFSSQGFVHRPQPASKVSYFCGRCHAAIKEKHLGSPHGENVHPTCTYCHGHHNIRAPDTTIIDPSRCTTCHDFRNAAQIRKILESTQANIQALEERSRWLEENGYRTLAQEEMHHHSRSTVTQLRVAFHSFHLGDVTNFASQLQAVLDQTQRTVDIVKRKNDARGAQIWVGLGAALFLFAFSVLLMTYKRLYLDHKPSPRFPAALLLAAVAAGLISCSSPDPVVEGLKSDGSGKNAPGNEVQQLADRTPLPGEEPPAPTAGREPERGAPAARGSAVPEKADASALPAAAVEEKQEKEEIPRGTAPARQPAGSEASPPALSTGIPVSPPGDSAPLADRGPGGSDEAAQAPRTIVAATSEEEKKTPPASAKRRPPGPGDMKSRDFNKDCFRSGCHASLKDFPELHGPLHVAACDACHEAQGEEADHKFRLARSKETLCTTCHRPAENVKFQHKPFEGAVCLDCHDPHGGATKSLLVGDNVGELCGKCHEPPKDKVLHGPVAVGECLLCHNAHQSDYEKLTVAPGKDLCVKCHVEVGDLVANAAYAHGPAAVDCGACHFPHGGEDRRLLRKEPKSLCLTCHDSVAETLARDSHVHGAMDGEPACLGCHTPHASQFKSQLRAVAGELCLTCHDKEIVNPTTKKRVANVAKDLASAKFKHGPVQTGDCQGCHFPHSSSHMKLLRESYPAAFYKEFAESNYALCFRCHEKTLVLDEHTTTLTRFRDGDRNLHFLHVNKEKGRTCRACHEVHASNLPSHVRKSVPFGASAWMLPINFEKKENGGACSPGCHKPKSYAYAGAGSGTAAPAVETSRTPPAGK